jgi:ABC-type bacteriocin/lantibiotic exporter with double-glycine peptidase domain
MINLLSTRAVLFGSVINIRLILEELVWARSARRPSVGVAPAPAANARFALENVTFSHTASTPPIIEHASLSMDHPSWLAVVGASGAGKSTLMELLCGIYVPQSGRIVHAWPQSTAPRLAYLPQHVALLQGSIRENVIFGLDAGDASRIERVLHLACLDDFVGAQTEGLQTQVGADGARLSGGQRQRLALARALYREPDLLLLDEATSGLDEDTETRLFSRLREHCPTMSVVFITHRAGCLRFADQVVRVEGGRVVLESVRA